MRSGASVIRSHEVRNASTVATGLHRKKVEPDIEQERLACVQPPDHGEAKALKLTNSIFK